MTHVWITQCLCPQRHCILAATGEADDAEQATAEIADRLREAITFAISTREMNPWCGLCHATIDTWRYQTDRTRFATMAAAKPHLERLQAEQIATGVLSGEILGDMLKS